MIFANLFLRLVVWNCSMYHYSYACMHAWTGE